MQVFVALLFMLAGASLYALHVRVCHKKECAAFQNGFDQAVKETKIRQEAVEQYFKAHARPIVPAGPEEQGNITPLQAAQGEVFPPDFMDRLRRDGRAVARVK